jgi:hypothetical protein
MASVKDGSIIHLMASRRMLHCKIWDSDQFNKLTISERLLYICLITLSDDHGCFRADAKFLKKSAFYYDRIGVKKVQKMLDHIASVGLIKTGLCEKGLAGIHPNWKKYQSLRPERCKLSEFPEMLSAKCPTSSDSLTAEENVIEDSLKEGNLSSKYYEEQYQANTPREKMQRALEKAKNEIKTLES